MERNRLYQALGIVLLLAGSAILVFGLPVRWFVPSFQYERQGELKPGDAAFPQLESFFKADKLLRYAVRHGGGELTLEAAEYRDSGGKVRRVLLPRPEALGKGPDAAWTAAAKAIREHTAENALFLAWWDNGQRIHFLAGREAWAASPVAGAFPDAGPRAFWRDAAGDFAADPQPLAELAHWLAMDAEAALREMGQRLPQARDIYFLVTTDDLARLNEMEALAGVPLPLETRVFPGGGNFHGLIAQVKRWAQDQGEGNYLVQPLPGGDVRAWRVDDAQGNGLLLTRLLPFTASLTQPLAELGPVYQSENAYLTIYRWSRK